MDDEFALMLKNEFLAEASELLEETESLFIQLERAPENQSIIDKIFRVVHTIKGSGSVAGFKDLSAFAHVFETYLSRVRSHELKVDKSVIDVLLAGTDVLKQFVAALKSDHNATLDTSATLSLIEGGSSAKTSQLPQSPAAQDLMTFEFATQPRDKPLGKPRILVIDDEPELRDYVAQVLQGLNAEVQTAANGQDALELWQKGAGFDLVISDQKMPQMSGAEFIGRLREIAPDVPVIIVSGATNRAEAIAFIKLGVVDFLDKPIDETALLQSARNALKLHLYRKAIDELSGLALRSYFSLRNLIELLETKFGDLNDPAIARCSATLKAMGILINRVTNLEI